VCMCVRGGSERPVSVDARLSPILSRPAQITIPMKAILKQTKEQRDGFQKKLAELQKNLQKMVQTCASKKAAYDKLKKVRQLRGS